jgi:hypothetical protein
MTNPRVASASTAAGDPVTVEGRDRAPRWPWNWIILVLLLPFLAGLALIVIGTRVGGSMSGTVTPEILVTGPPTALIGVYMAVSFGTLLVLTLVTEQLLNWNRRTRFNLSADRGGLAYRVEPAHEPERSSRWRPDDIADVRDTSAGLLLVLRDGEEVKLPLGRSSEDERKLADEVVAAMGLAREEST